MFTPRSIRLTSIARTSRSFATVSSIPPVATSFHHHKVVVIGGGSAGLNISHQLLHSGRFTQNDIAIVDPAEWHHYQPGWTLVGAGLKTKQELRRPLKSLIDSKLKFYNAATHSFAPEESFITLGSGEKVSYDHLIVAPGIRVDFSSIAGLSDALANPDANVSSTYSYEYCDKVFTNLSRFKQGKAIFTQPGGLPIKCAGGPQKIMWLGLDKWKKAGLYNPSAPETGKIQISFATSMGVMFGVPKYSAKLNELREARGVEGLFGHDLISIEGNTATFAKADGEQVKKHFDFLHAVPKMGPHEFMKNSSLVNATGFTDIHEATLQHKKYANIWGAGDSSSLPTSKTAAAITAQAPILVRNLLQTMDGKQADAEYDGYTSCPLLTEYGKVMLAEFKYGGVPKETFGVLGLDQGTPRRAFYHLKKDFFPWVYYKSMVKGRWAGPKGWMRN